MAENSKCPVCQNVDGGHCSSVRTPGENFGFDCSICGRFEVDNLAFNWLMRAKEEQGEPSGPKEITRMRRALISHKLRSRESPDEPYVITEEWIEYLIANARLPSPSVQVVHLIRFVGDLVSQSGERLEKLPDHTHAVVGAPNRNSVIELAIELKEKQFLKLESTDPLKVRGHSFFSSDTLSNINLTLEGWQRYEDERQGRLDGHYGFLARKFNEPLLDSFVAETLRPATKELGYDLVDMRDVARAGVIDNIMRTQIRYSTFVISDLTHDNSGAYWEAGYAEGLGKPVIYICESMKFDEESTHFDTNHCTTVPWSADDPDTFRENLIATLRRSLDQE